MIKVSDINYSIEMPNEVSFGKVDFDNGWGATVRRSYGTTYDIAMIALAVNSVVFPLDSFYGPNKKDYFDADTPMALLSEENANKLLNLIEKQRQCPY